MRLIDADALLKHEIKRCDGEMPFIGTCSTNNFTLKSEIDKFPTVDAVPVVSGKWIKSDFLYIGANQYRCSECWKDEWWLHHFSLGDSNYCPNCGAKMDGDK